MKAEDLKDAALDLNISGTSEPLTFEIKSSLEKMYYANGEKDVLLSAKEADELLDYIQYMQWLTSPHNGTDWHDYLVMRRKEFK